MMNLSNILIVLLLSASLQLSEAKSQYQVIKQNVISSRITLDLSYTGTQTYYGNPKSPIVKNLRFVLQVQSYSDFFFKIIDRDNQRFEVPQKGAFPIDPKMNFSFPISASMIEFSYTPQPFDFKITRRSDGTILFSTYEQNIIYSDYYLQIGTEIASDYVYGIGQRFQQTFRKKDGKWTIFNRDHYRAIDKGTGFQTYGYYPFYLLREESNYFHINYFRSSNAMDVIKFTQKQKKFITWKIIGGVIDFRFILVEKDPQMAIRNLHQITGRSTLPPFWSLGFHQCRWGYKNISYLENMVASYKQAGLPLDVIWSDIDYLKDFQIFTYDQSKFPLDRVKKLIQGFHYVLIIDAGFKMSGPAYQQGLRRNVFLKDARGVQNFVGQVFPGSTTFVDYFHPNSTQFLVDMLAGLYAKIQFSGVWLDMNQIDSFCNGPCTPPKGEAIFDYTNDLPYQPGSDPIQTMTVSLNASHYGGIQQANVHPYHSLLQVYSANKFLKTKSQLPFILTRSSTFGSSKYAFHWTGDNVAKWEYLRTSIIDHFSNQMFGFQYIGSEICGFRDNTTEELCARWFQLGSLYPFSRNHNDNQSISQEPYALGPVVFKAAFNNLKLRYSILKYYYSLFIQNQGEGTILRPLFFNYPKDSVCYNDQVSETHIMFGSDLMAAPIVYKGTTERSVYFPQTNWYDLHTGKMYEPGFSLISGVQLTDLIPLFLAEGSILSRQNTQNVTKTSHLDNHFTFVGAMSLDKSFSNATHKIYQADGQIASVSDYSDEKKISRCGYSGCSYQIILKAKMTPQSSKLQIQIRFFGDITLKQVIYCDSVLLYLPNRKIQVNLSQPLKISGRIIYQIDINQQATEILEK